jgi:diadenosine tetraphosphate (Ap4A) HIT family hydrolase
LDEDYGARVKRHRERNCVFCEWLNPEKTEDWNWFVRKEGYRLIDPDPAQPPQAPPEYIVILARDPKVAGHTLVIWGYPYDDICDASEDAIKRISKVCLRYSLRIKEKLLAEKVYIYSMCDHYEKWELKEENQPTTEHLHFHLLPRYPGAPKGEQLICLPTKKAGVDWEATPITMRNLADILRFKDK